MIEVKSKSVEIRTRHCAETRKPSITMSSEWNKLIEIEKIFSDRVKFHFDLKLYVDKILLAKIFTIFARRMSVL